jgi:uncharacterized protein involved in exopolysaccharide biosynthesis
MAEEVKGFAEHLSGFLRHWKLAAVTFVAIMAVGFGIAFSLPDIYRSSGFILIEEPEIPQELLRSTVTTYATRQVTTLNEKILTIDNLSDIINRFNMYADRREDTPIELLALEVRQNIEIEIQSRDSVSQSGVPQSVAVGFTVSYDSENPAVAKQVVDELVSLYLDQNLRTRTEQTSETAEFLSGQVVTLESQIAELETKLARFKEDNAESLPSLNTLNLQQMNRIDGQLREISRQLNVINENRISIEAQMAVVRPTQPTPLADGTVALSPADQLKSLQTQLSIVQSRYSEEHPDVIALNRDIESLRSRFGLDVNLAELDQELTAAKADLAVAREKYSADHPDVVALDRQVADLERQINEVSSQQMEGQLEPDNPAYISLQAALNKLDAEESALLADQRSLRNKQADYEARLIRTPQIEKDLAALSRELSSTTNRYWVMRDKQFAAQMGETLETSAKGEEMILIEPPRVPLAPYKPDRTAILALAFLFALVAGLAITQLVDSFDHSIRGAAAIISVQGSPPLAEIPYIKTAAEEDFKKVFRKRAIAASPAMVVVALVVVHFAVMPFDLLFARLLGGF